MSIINRSLEGFFSFGESLYFLLEKRVPAILFSDPFEWPLENIVLSSPGGLQGVSGEKVVVRVMVRGCRILQLTISFNFYRFVFGQIHYVKTIVVHSKL